MSVRRRLEPLAYRPIVGRRLLYPISRWGYDRFERTGETPHFAYAAMRKLYGNEDGTIFDRLVDRTRSTGPAPASAPFGPGIAALEIEAAVQRLRLDGYAILEARLPSAQCDALERTARAAACRAVGPDGVLPEPVRFDEERPIAIRYDLAEHDILESPAAQQLVADPSLFEIAARYLGAEPVQDLVAMWWSAAVSGTDRGAAEAAQQFHFDLDRLRFLKVFVFLTDVDEARGPHVYVRGTHRAVPARFRVDGRHGDDEVFAAFADEVREITGPRGMIFLADTRGLHKGKNLEVGHRLVFQTEYATSLFGSPYTRPVIRDPIPLLVQMRDQHPAAFARFELIASADASG